MDECDYNVSAVLKYAGSLLFSHNVLEARKALFALLEDGFYDLLLLHLLVLSYIMNGEYNLAVSLLEAQEIEPFSPLFFDLMSLYIKLNMGDKIRKLYSIYFTTVDFNQITKIEHRQMFIYLNNKFSGNLSVKGNELFSLRMLNHYVKGAVVSKIKFNHSDVNNVSMFNDLDISKLYYKVQSYIGQNATCGKLFLPVFDEYYFYLDNCGICDGGSTDYFRVLTIVNTPNIITMYPVLYNKYNQYVSLEDGVHSYMKVKTSSIR